MGKLVVIEGIMNRFKYLQLLQDNLLPSAVQMRIQNTFKYYEDNDPKHKSRLVQVSFIQMPQNVASAPQLPDLNPI